MESVTKMTRINGKWHEQLLMEGMTYGDALGAVMRLRRFTNNLIAIGLATEERRTYYRLGRPYNV